jgi:hypothetical protein
MSETVPLPQPFEQKSDEPKPESEPIHSYLNERRLSTFHRRMTMILDVIHRRGYSILINIILKKDRLTLDEIFYFKEKLVKLNEDLKYEIIIAKSNAETYILHNTDEEYWNSMINKVCDIGDTIEREINELRDAVPVQEVAVPVQEVAVPVQEVAVPVQEGDEQ